LDADITYVVGGITANGNFLSYANDIWASSDQSLTWVRITPELKWLEGIDTSNLLISKDGILILATWEVRLSSRLEQSNLYMSFDGGLSWAVCQSGAEYGTRLNPGLALDAQGWLYVLGGQTGNKMLNDIWRSDISVYNLDQLASACGTVVPTGGVGLQKWPQVSSSTGGWSFSSSSSTTGIEGSSPSSPMSETSSSGMKSSTGATRASSENRPDRAILIVSLVLVGVFGLIIGIYVWYRRVRGGEINCVCWRAHTNLDSDSRVDSTKLLSSPYREALS
jgi:hypothetical protein